MNTVTAPLPDAAVVARARWALMGLFVLFGVTQTSWLSRLPSVRAGLDVSSAQLGTFLMVGAVGALVAVFTSGAVVTRLGSRTTLVACAIGNAAAQTLLAVAVAVGNVPLFLVGALLNGLTGPGMNTPLNICAARVEQAVGRAIMPHFHAGFSIGAAAGALVSAGSAAADVSVTAQMVALAVVGVTLRLLLAGPATELAPAHEPARAGAGGSLRTALTAWREPRTVLIGLVLLAGSLSEGSASNWLSIATVDGFHVREAIGAAAYGTFVGAMTVVRLGGTRLIDRFGRVTMLRASGVAGLLGLLGFGLLPTWWLAFVAVVFWGMGSALASPVAMAAASDEPERAAARVSVASSFMSFASITAPPLLGLLADAVGARHALLVICAAMVLSLSVAGAVRRPTATRA